MNVVLGSGSWGTTLAIVLARHQQPVTLLTRTREEADELRLAGENRRFLPGVPFPPSLDIMADTSVLRDAATLIVAVPSSSIRAAVHMVAPRLSPAAIVVSGSKGLVEAAPPPQAHPSGPPASTPGQNPAGRPELAPAPGARSSAQGGGPGLPRRLTQVIAEVLPNPVCALSGPNLAREVARSLPATTVVAAEDQVVALAVQRLFTDRSFRVYTSTDVIGVELGGALKNVVALAAGAADGMQLGDNAKAALITRGLAEISRLGSALGAQPLTFAGLAGLGDLVATCASPLSRNRRLGEALAAGHGLEEAQREVGQVAEGVPTTHAAVSLARQANVELPIAQQMYAVLFEHKDPRQAVLDLMQREPKPEW